MDRNFLDPQSPRLRDYADALVHFLQPWEWLWRMHLVDFFVSNAWQSVPQSWLSALSNCPMGELLLVPSGHVREGDWPPDLVLFVQSAFQLSLSTQLLGSQNHQHGGKATEELLFQGGSSSQNGPLTRNTSTANSDCFINQWDAATSSLLDNTMSKVPPIMLEGMSPKKKHEVGRLVSLVRQLARVAGTCHVIDLGSGQGYLSQLLAFVCGLDVVAVDCSLHHAAVVKARAERIRKYVRRRRGEWQRQQCVPGRNCRLCRGEMAAEGEEAAPPVTEPGTAAAAAAPRLAATSEPRGPSQLTRTIQLHGSEGTLTAVIDAHFSERSSESYHKEDSSPPFATVHNSGIMADSGAGAPAAAAGEAPCSDGPLPVGDAGNLAPCSLHDSGVFKSGRGSSKKGNADNRKESSEGSEKMESGKREGEVKAGDGATGARTGPLEDDVLVGATHPGKMREDEKEEGGRGAGVVTTAVGPGAQAASQEGVVLVGLHACGDLTVAAVRAFIRCHRVAALAIVGCCYNRLTEGGGVAEAAGRGPEGDTGVSSRQCDEQQWRRKGEDETKDDEVKCERREWTNQGVPEASHHPSCGQSAVNSSISGRTGISTQHSGATHPHQACGFPVSRHLQCHGLVLGHSGRDLACQSAHKWRVKRVEEACSEFEAHAFRAALQVILSRSGWGKNEEVQLGEVEQGKSECEKEGVGGRIDGREGTEGGGIRVTGTNERRSRSERSDCEMHTREGETSGTGSAVSSRDDKCTGGSETLSEGHRRDEEKASRVLCQQAPTAAVAVRVGRLGKARRRRQRMAQVMNMVEGGGGGGGGSQASAQAGGINPSVDEYNVELLDLPPSTCEAPHGPSRVNGRLIDSCVLESPVTEEQSADHTRLTHCDHTEERLDEVAASDLSRMDAQTRSFHHYCQQALQRMDFPSDVSASKVTSVWREVHPHVRAIAAVWVLRAVLAGPLEALIIVDRLLMMEESGGTFKPGGVTHGEGRSKEESRPSLEFDVVPLFDPVISPRNMVIVAKKH